jgi:AraC-like DNA-binding protein
MVNPSSAGYSVCTFIAESVDVMSVHAALRTTSSQDRLSSSLPLSAAGDIRIGPLLAIPLLLSEMGVPPQQVFEAAGIAPGDFSHAEQRISQSLLGDLLEACIRFTGCEHFGLLVGERFDLDGLGTIGMLMRHSPTLGDALYALVLHLHLHDRGAVPLLLEVSDSFMLLGYGLYNIEQTATAPIQEVALAIGQRILNQLCGPAWIAHHVQFSSRSPVSVRAYRRVFRTRLRFDAEMPGLLFHRHWLDKPISGADPAVYAQLVRQLSAVQAEIRLGEQVERILQQMLPGGYASAQSISKMLGISERTLRRRLAAEETSLHLLVSRTRFEMAQQLLRNTHLSVAAVAAFLQYEDANAFSRAFKGWAGISPLRWRRVQRQDLLPV